MTEHEQHTFLFVKCSDLKELRAALCRAQHAILVRGADKAWITNDCQRIGELIREIDRNRPIGLDGKHGSLHTETCGCEDVPFDGRHDFGVEGVCSCGLTVPKLRWE